MSFDGFINDIQFNNLNVHGVEFYQKGKLVDSFGDTIQTRYPIYSATKTITSIAVGIAFDEGKIKMEESILKYLPSEVVEKLSKKQKEVYSNITVERLMTMSVKGYPFRPKGKSWLETSLRVPLESPEERVFDYSNIPAYLVGVAASCAVEEDLYEYLNRKLFTPLGIENPSYGRCPDGYFYGASNMELTVNELSRIGLLLYNNGVYENQRIISENYVRAATSVQQTNKEGGYGYFVWKYRDGFSINGKWKQKCYVLPSQEKIISFLSDIQDSAPVLKESMERNLLNYPK